MKCGIYQIRCLVNNKMYIGSSVNIKYRCQKHFSFLRKGTHPNKFLQNAYVKYGEDNFIVEVLEECKEDETLIIEQRWLDKIQPYKREIGYNLCERVDQMPVNVKEYIVTFPNGEEKLVKNLYKFARKNNLNIGNLCQTAHGGARSCKGFKCRLKDMSIEEWENIQRKNNFRGRPRIHPIKVPFRKTGTGWKGFWEITSPNGEVLIVDVLYKFCKDHGLSGSAMSAVSLGKRRHHKGYFCRRID